MAKKTIRRVARNESLMDRLIHLAAIPLISAAVMLVGWYYLTSYRQDETDKTVKSIKAQQTVQTDEDRKEREKLRDKFLDNQLKTNEILGKLDARLAVSETKQESTNQVLNRISDQLQRLNAKDK